MTKTQLRLSLLCAGVLALQLVGTAVAVAFDLPAQFGGEGTDAAAEWASRGTALSPPVAPLVALALAVVLLRRPGRWAALGCTVAAVLAVLFTIGSLGEAFSPATAEVPRAVVVWSGVTGTLTGIAMLAGVVLTVRERRRRRPVAVTA